MSDVATTRERGREEAHQVSARRAATRERLSDAAVRVFARKGVDGATVEEICEEADFTRGAFYSNFGSKNELCIDVLQRSLDRAFEALTVELPKASATELPMDEKLNLAIELTSRTISGDPDTVLAISEIRLQAARDPALRPAYRALNESATPALRELVVEVMEANDVHIDIPVDDLLGIMRTLYDQQMIEALISGAPDKAGAVSSQMATLLKALMRG
ncbi:TetR/AcrR family transcriptional regulator [Acidipropionibacterium virtanenii]|uniref:Putative HTH-type transcriptional regulator TtgW n=1 Tax=Acidipropionibacterium virtanenii TaxID=2057246 RepID=A0A344UPY9_9ACTN|nr:TetR/AcrR family transcriptional regulator [Acidipropionibacterium virtanenii]AXE37337.1 putative HTH-type transcriptional regulator TtgW [Acidipropionibacterium virtanenii]